MNALLTMSSYGAQLLQTFGALLIVCALAVIALRFAARRGIGAAGANGSRLKLAANLSVGPRQRVAILEVDDQEVLIGISEQHISLLHELPGRQSQSDEGSDESIRARALGLRRSA